VSLLQRVRFAWKRYRFVDPGLRTDDEVAGALPTSDAGAS
jgi:hypothetical protein